MQFARHIITACQKLPFHGLMVNRLGFGLDVLNGRDETAVLPPTTGDLCYVCGLLKLPQFAASRDRIGFCCCCRASLTI